MRPPARWESYVYVVVLLAVAISAALYALLPRSDLELSVLVVLLAAAAALAGPVVIPALHRALDAPGETDDNSKMWMTSEGWLLFCVLAYLAFGVWLLGWSGLDRAGRDFWSVVGMGGLSLAIALPLLFPPLGRRVGVRSLFGSGRG